MLKETLKYSFLPVLLAWLAISGWGAAALAQQVSVELGAGKRQVGINETVVLTVTVSGQATNLPQPRLENLGPFQVSRSGSSSNISMINGRVTASLSVNYTLVPNKEGTFTIGPASVEVGGKRYTSGTVDITVTGSGGGSGQQGAPPAGNAPQGSQKPSPPRLNRPQPPASGSASAYEGNIFIRHMVDKQEAYVGEQLVYTFGYYNRLRNIDNPSYTPATFTGFWAEEIDKQARHATREVRGRVYQVQELRTALFPTTVGEATISGAKLSYQYRNVWDFFDRGETSTLTTRPITVRVKPLPRQGRPAGFKGAVGDYTNSIKIDKTTVGQGEAITLEYTISGRGNISTLPEVTIPGIEDFDIYESQSEEHIDRSGPRISGRKVYSFVIVPRSAGEYNLPPVEFSFFNPADEKYHTVRTDPVSFRVTPSEQQESVTYRLSPEAVVTVGEDIRYIKEDAGAALSMDRAAGAIPGTVFWLAHTVPLLAVAGALLWRRHRGRLLSDTGYARLRGAGKRLERELKRAGREASAGDFTAAYASLDRALSHFIGDKLNLETAGMLSEQIEELLAARDVEKQLREDVRGCLDHFSYVRFAPQSGADRETVMEYLKKVRKLAGRLDRAL